MTNAIKLNPSEQQLVRVEANLLYSGDPNFIVDKGESYSIVSEERQIWKDSWICTDPRGYFNPLLWLAPPRLKGVACFCLCGTIDKNEIGHFQIGERLKSITIPKSGTLYFFANDNLHYYGNNKGHICITVTRIS